MPINICFISDDNFALQTRFAINSIILNSTKGTKICIYVIAVNMSQKNIDLFNKIQASNTEIHIIKEENKYKELGLEHLYVSKAALLKFELPNIFNKKDKILYLDGDIFVTGDLNELYHTDISDAYAAMAPDHIAQIEGKDNIRLEIKTYCNSGVMLLNLKKMRKDKITVKLLDFKKNDEYNKYMDQDAFNKIFANKIKILDSKYNYIYIYKEYLQRKDFEFLKNQDKVIMHFAGGNKPYGDITHEMAPDLIKIGLLEDVVSCQNKTILKLHKDNISLKEKINILASDINKLHMEIKEQKLKSRLKHIVEALFYKKDESKRIVKLLGFPILKIERFTYKISISCCGVKINFKPYIIREKINTRYISYINKIKLDKKIKSFSEYGLTKRKRSPRLIISLTSFPQRMYDIHFTIYSLLNQDTKPDAVILWLGYDKFPNKEKDLPENLLRLCKCGLTIKWCKDIKAFTKLLPSLEEFPEDVIVTADDDIYYPNDWLKKLYKQYKKEKNFIYCHRAHQITLTSKGNIAPYNSWIKETSNHIPSYTSFLTGVGGVLYPPHCLPNEVFSHNFKKLCFHNDDIWFWAMAVLNGTKIKVVNDNIDSLIYVNAERELGNTNETTLAKTNVIGNLNEKQLRQVLETYKEVNQHVINDLRNVFIDIKRCPSIIARKIKNETIRNLNNKEVGILSYGPYINLLAGRYQLKTEYKMMPNTRVTVEIKNKQKTFACVSLNACKEFSILNIPFSSDDNIERLEVKVTYNGNGYVWLKDFYINPA